MNAPWFEPNYYAWIPGALIGIVGGTWGSLAGFSVPRGKNRKLLAGMGWAILAASAALLAAGLVALATGQPYGIWYGLGLPGLIGLAVTGPLMRTLSSLYRQVEQRKITARDF